MNDFWYAVAIGVVVGIVWSLLKFATQIDMGMTLDYLFVRRTAARYNQAFTVNNDASLFDLHDRRYFFQWQTLPYGWYWQSRLSP